MFLKIHGDNKTWKLVSCVYGKIDAYIVNCEKKSKNLENGKNLCCHPKSIDKF